MEKIDEFRPIGRAAEVDGVKINVVGMARHENELQLIILQHNKALSKSIKERLVVHNLACNGESPGTSGGAHCPLRNIPLDNFMQTAMSIDIGNGDLRVKGASTGRLDSNEWESAAMISYFLQNGWEPEGIGSENIEELYMTTFYIMGEHSRIPDFDEDSIIRAQITHYYKTFRRDDVIM